MGILRSAARRLPPKLKGFIKASRVSLLENLENKAAVDASEKAGRPLPFAGGGQARHHTAVCTPFWH